MSQNSCRIGVQDGNGNLARQPGGALAPSASAEATPTSSAAPIPAGVEVDKIGSSTTYNFSVDLPRDENNPFAPTTSSVSVVTSDAGSTARRNVRSIDFFVDGRVTSDTRALAGPEIATKVSQIFRHDVSQQPDGTLYSTSATRGDIRGEFRTASYARAGFSFPGGSPDATASSRGGQYGTVRNGKLIPSDSSGTPFTGRQQEQHRAKVRTELRQAVRRARDDKFGGQAPRVAS